MLYRFRMINGYETTHDVEDLAYRIRIGRFVTLTDENGYETMINMDNVVAIEALEPNERD